MEKIPSDGLPLPQRYGAIATIIIGISMAVLDGRLPTLRYRPLPAIFTHHPRVQSGSSMLTR